MRMPGRNRSAEKIGCKAALILLISVAVLSNAVKDLNRMQELTVGAAHSVFELLDAGVVTVQAKGASFMDSSCAAEGGSQVSSKDFSWTGRVASGKAVEIKGINGDIDAQPAAGDEIEVLAKKKARRSDPNEVRIQVVEHAGGVTICAMYPTDNPNQQADCVPGPKDARGNQSATINVRKTFNGSINLRRVS